jgi:hypothetical protein
LQACGKAETPHARMLRRKKQLVIIGRNGHNDEVD